MKVSKQQKLNQVGDTIVEVLLAVVVVGLAIGLGYGVASRSLKANRQAQERGEALKKVEGQLERLKKRAVTDVTGSGVFRSNSYCLATVGQSENEPVNLDSSPPANVADDPLDGAYDDACVDGLYHLSITPDTTTPNQFTVRARWFGLGGQEKEETSITYRAYPGT